MAAFKRVGLLVTRGLGGVGVIVHVCNTHHVEFTLALPEDGFRTDPKVAKFTNAGLPMIVRLDHIGFAGVPAEFKNQ